MKLFINTATAILLFVLVMFVSEIKNSEVMKSYKGVIQTHRVLMQFWILVFISLRSSICSTNLLPVSPLYILSHVTCYMIIPRVNKTQKQPGQNLIITYLPFITSSRFYLLFSKLFPAPWFSLRFFVSQFFLIGLICFITEVLII